MRIFVMGSGGTGAYFGAKLARAGFDVTFIARGAHLQAMQQQGLKIAGQEEFHLQPVQAVSDPTGLAPADVIIFAVKSYDTDSAIELIRPVVSERTMIVPIQNGVDSYDRLGAVFGHEAVVGGLCRISAEIAGPGVIQVHSPFREIVFGEMNGAASERTAAFAAALQKAEVQHKLSTEIQVDLWKKFTFITAFSGITGATRSPIGPIRESAETFELYRRIAAEVVAVARAESIPLSDTLPDNLVSQAQGHAPGFKASLLVDIENGKRTEVETLQGHVVRLGRKHGVPTPVTEVIYALLKLHQPR